MGPSVGVRAVVVCLLCACGDDDARRAEAGPDDSGFVDAGDTDAGEPDWGAADAGPADAGPALVTAMTEHGPVAGVDRGTSLMFRGIPYAAPPMGALRFAPPAAPTAWSTPVDATGPGTVCLQHGASGVRGDEDCLHLNVWTPALTGSRPVMVFIHGGAFAAFSASEPVFDATRVAVDGDVVVVSANYRLGPFGFLAHPSLAGPDETTGNWGLLDQQAALRWVRDNVAQFGGDPTNVTIFGESAGAMSVGLHLVAAGSEGLFERAMAQSGPAVWTLLARDRAEELGGVAAGALGCTGDVASCLRGASSLEVLDALSPAPTPGGLFNQADGMHYRPTLDGVVFDAQPLARFRAGTTLDVPIVYGTNTDEGTVFHGAVFGTAVTDEAEYRAALDRMSQLGLDGRHTDAIVAQYPVSELGTANDALTQVTSDGAFTCATRYTARLLASTGRTVRLYRFDQAPADVAVPRLGVFHAAELLFLFGTSHLVLGNPTSAPELGPAMRGYWTRFAAAGDPGGDPSWPVWSPETDIRLHLAAALDTESAYLDARCDFWDAIYETL